MKSGFVSIIGRPNVGKSTLLNAILDFKVAIISNKAGTTRNIIQGIYNEEDTQIIFLDTPGIHKPESKLGKILNKERLKKIVSGKIGKVLRIKYSDIDKADEWFDKKGNKTVFFCRFIPIVRSLISIPAGMSEMPLGKFTLYTVVGSLIWNTVLSIAGQTVGANWESILAIFEQYSHIAAIVLVILGVGAIVWFYSKKRTKKSKTK